MFIHNMEYITSPEYCKWNDLNEGDKFTIYTAVHLCHMQCVEQRDTMEIYFQS